MEKPHFTTKRLLPPSDCCKQALENNAPVYRHGKIITTDSIPVSVLSIFCKRCNQQNKFSNESWKSTLIMPSSEEYQEAKDGFLELTEPREIEPEEPLKTFGPYLSETSPEYLPKEMPTHIRGLEQFEQRLPGDTKEGQNYRHRLEL